MCTVALILLCLLAGALAVILILWMKFTSWGP